MNATPSEGEGDHADDPTGLRDLWQDRPAGHLDGVVVVRTDHSLTHDNQSNAVQEIVDSAGSQPVARPSGVILP